MALRARCVVTAAVCLLALMLSGCGVFQWIESLGKDEDDVPVTRPTDVDPEAAEQVSARPSEPEAEPADPEGPKDTGAPDQSNAPVDPNTEATGDPNRSSGDPNAASETMVVSGGSLRVNNEFISAEEIVRHASARLAALPKGLSLREFRVRAERILGETIQQRIHMTLVLAEARKNAKEQVTAWVDSQVADYRRSLIAQAGSVEKLKADLEARHTTLEQALQARREQLQYQMFLRDRFDSAIVITRSKLWRYYRMNQKEFASPKRVQFRLITIPTGEDKPARDEAHKKAEKAINEIENGTDFAKVARTYSKGPRRDKGGLWPKMGQGEFAVEAVDKILFSTEEGKVSPIIDGGSALFIVKMVDVEPAKVAPFEEAQKTIAEKLREKQRRALHDEYYSKLYAAANINRSEGFLEKVRRIAIETFYRGE